MDYNEVSNNSLLVPKQAFRRHFLTKSKSALIAQDEDGVIQYCCLECPSKYTEKEQLEIHLCTHNKEYRFLCAICGAGLKRKEHLDRHYLEHQEVRPHACPYCEKAFKRKEHLNIHLSTHSGVKSQACTLCDKSFYRKDHLQKHLQTHNKIYFDQELMAIKQELMDEEEMKLVNDDTEEKFIYDISTDPERPFACCFCGKTYKRKDHLKLHILTHKKKDKICSVCGKAFHRDQQLLTHMTVHLKSFTTGEDGDDNETLQQLQAIADANREQGNLAAFTTNSEVPDETKASKPPKPIVKKPKSDVRPHECEVCHRRFKRRQHLKAHSNVHRKLEPTIWCSLCNVGFYSDEHFEGHQCISDPEKQTENCNGQQSQNTSQEESNAKKENDYPELGDEAMNDDIVLDEKQYVSVIEEQDIPVPLRVFVCKHCSKPFKRKDHYKIHLNIHTGIKSFFCPDCGKGFYRKDHLQKHYQVHTKEKLKQKKQLPALYPIKVVQKKKNKDVKPEIIIHAPSNSKIRVPLQMKVPYQMVVSLDNGEQRAVTIDPMAAPHHQITA